MLSLSDFKVDRQIFEARFPQSLLLWDRAGEMWTSISRNFENLKMVSAVPNNTQFETESFYLVVEPVLLRIVAKDDRSFDEFEKHANSFFRIVVDSLEIELFERLGIRTMWAKQFPTMSEASEALRSLDIFRKFKGESFGFEAPSATFDAKTTWEDRHNGAMLGLRTEKRRVEPQVPWEVRSQLSISTEERHLFIVDVDYHTVPKLQRDQIDVKEWISSSQRIVKKALAKEVFK